MIRVVAGRRPHIVVRGFALMSWSWRVGRLAGIPLYVHWTFLILIAWVVMAHWLQGQDVASTLEGVGFILAIFGCVVLHELGHALAARRYGIKTADITLLPIGGVARLESIPEKPGRELFVALAGPAVNVVIVAILLAVGARPFLPTNEARVLVSEGFFARLLEVNIFLVVFNLVPAFPMDGGRVLRALLAMTMEYSRATRLAASIGQAIAIVFGFLGLTGNPMLLLIALFVWIGAEAEANAVRERVELRGLTVREAMLTEFEVLQPTDTLAQAAESLLAGSQQDFPVVSATGEPLGVLTRASLMRALAASGPTATVSSAPLVALGEVEAVSALTEVVARLRQSGSPCVQVVEHGRPIGLLNLENIGEFLMVRSALAVAGARGRTPASASPMSV
jgi:Zn-dependent protease